MPEFPDTDPSLIAKIGNHPDHAAWEEFEQLYRPIIFRIARAKGLQHADALDLVQQVLLSVSMAIDRFDPHQPESRFRHWLSRVTRNAILKALSRGPRDRAAGGSAVIDVLSEVPSPDAATDALIHLEQRREIFARAAVQVRREVKESTWLAFEWTVLQQVPIRRAAEILGLSVGNVYAARSRLIRRLRDAIRRFDGNHLEAPHDTSQ
ncbi:MAG: sigma-70 family RNA polymerase sigma factor [Planctomycetota bacterium]